MGKTSISNSDEPIRLFKSDFLELFTHISPITVIVIWLPVAGFFIFRTLVNHTGWMYVLPIGLLLGLFSWSLAEYMLHRCLFHFPAKTPQQERLSILFHGIHHEQPRIKTRLVMPPVVSIPLAIIFLGLILLIFSYLLAIPDWMPPVFAGFIVGYVFYDLTHYATHHFRMRNGYFRTVRQHHMHHHFQTPNQRFGVTSILWDIIFRTLPK